jgi:ABC-type Fe3+ transport system substrate-binding protein
MSSLSLSLLNKNSLSANTNKTSAVPTSYQDFTKPEYKDKIVLTYPNDDDAILYQFDLMYVHISVFCMQID